jgi:1-acylglycerone phosphate reductase
MAKQPTVLITGCSEGGIGYSLALQFARQNYQVFAASRRLSSMESLSSNPNITLIELDVNSLPSIQSAFSLISGQTGGTLNILYHNAGVRSIVPAIHSSWDLAESTFKTNFFAVVEITRVFMPLILNGGPGGKIVFSNSVAAVVPIPTQGMYDASKAALDMYAKVLDMELRPLGVHVVNVITGEVGTTMAEQNMEKLPEGFYFPLLLPVKLLILVDSPYLPIKDIIDRVWSVRKTVMPVNEYAEQVVRKVIQRSPPTRIWCGGNSTMVWFVETLGMQWIYRRMFSKEYGLDKLRPPRC